MALERHEASLRAASAPSFDRMATKRRGIFDVWRYEPGRRSGTLQNGPTRLDAVRQPFPMLATQGKEKASL
jgi:hypothetical protein